MSETNKEIVRRVNESFARNTPEPFLQYCTDDTEWNMIGQPVVKGRAEIQKLMEYMSGYTNVQMSTDTIIAEGDRAACNGTMGMTSPAGKAFKGAFCDMYHFQDGMIRSLTSYVVSLEDKQKSEPQS